MITKLKQTPGLYLMGFMGAGKTTVGKLLAEKLGWTFVDIDQEIEASEKRSIAEIFDTVGEPAFRQIETDVIKKRVRAVACGQPMVLALGGGAAAQPQNIELLETHGFTIWLTCPLDTLVQRAAQDAARPLSRDPKQFEELFHARQPAYERAHFHIANDTDDPDVAVNAILNLPLFTP